MSSLAICAPFPCSTSTREGTSAGGTALASTHEQLAQWRGGGRGYLLRSAHSLVYIAHSGGAHLHEKATGVENGLVVPQQVKHKMAFLAETALLDLYPKESKAGI